MKITRNFLRMSVYESRNGLVIETIGKSALLLEILETLKSKLFNMI